MAKFEPSPSGESANVVLLAPEPALTINSQLLTQGICYPLRSGDSLRVGEGKVRIRVEAPYSSSLWVWGPPLLLACAFVIAGAIMVNTAPEPVVETPTSAVDADEALSQRALAEAEGLVGLQAYGEAMAVLERAEAQLEDPWLRAKLNGRRAQIRLEATRAEQLAEAVQLAAAEVPSSPSEPTPAVPEVLEPAPVTKPAETQPQEPKPAEPAGNEPDVAKPVAVATPAPRKPFLQRVDEAIAAGVTQLRRSRLRPARPGEAALIAFALLRSGVSPSDPAVQDLFAQFLAEPLDQTYDLSVAILAIEAKSIQRTARSGKDATRTVARFQRNGVPHDDKQRIAELAKQLLAGQRAEGNWAYACPPAGTKTRVRRKPTTRTRGGRPASPQRLIGKQKPDNSNTQFAVLALHAAERSGVKVPFACWERVLGHFQRTVSEPSPLSRQMSLRLNGEAPAYLADGLASSQLGQGWAYRPYEPRYAALTPQMTAGGMSSVAIAADALQRAGRLKDAERAEAQQLTANAGAWLADSFSPGPRGVPPSQHVFYSLYSLEKAMEVSGVESLGGIDWYRRSANFLLGSARNGNWGTPIKTSFALLVLNRATLNLGSGTRVRRPAAATPVRSLTVRVGGRRVDLPQRLRALRTLESPRKELKTLTRAIAVLDGRERPRLVRELATLLNAQAEATVAFAKEQLKAITGESLDSARYAAWGRAYEQLRSAQAPLGPEDQRVLDQVLSQRFSGPLFSVAVLAAVRAQATHSVPLLVDALWRATGEDHAAVCSALRALTGEDPASEQSEEPEIGAAWRAWLAANKQGR